VLPADPAAPAEPRAPALPASPTAPALEVLPPWPAPAALVAPPVDVLPPPACVAPLPADATDIPPLPLVVAGAPPVPAGKPPVPAPDPPFWPEGVLLEHATSNTASVQVIGWIRMSFSIQSRDGVRLKPGGLFDEWALRRSRSTARATAASDHQAKRSKTGERRSVEPRRALGRHTATATLVISNGWLGADACASVSHTAGYAANITASRRGRTASLWRASAGSTAGRPTIRCSAVRCSAVGCSATTSGSGRHAAAARHTRRSSATSSAAAGVAN